MQNQEHGELQTELIGNVIILRVSGSFNESGAQGAIKRVKQLVRSLDGKPFYILSNELNYLGSTGEAYREGEEYNHWLNSQNLVVKAVVSKSAITRKMQKKLVPSMSDQKIIYFEEESEALEWLKSQKQFLGPTQSNIT